MKTKSPFALGLALLLSLIIAIPADISAEPQTAGQRAGEVSRVDSSGEHRPRLEDSSTLPRKQSLIGKTC